ncbi:MAG: ABC transporter ATP-binding protein [Chloroflexota bacterium]
MSTAILIQALTKSYHTPAGPAPALRGVDLQVQQGEFVAILGKSGAGKSTLVNTLTGIDRADGGRILVNGAPPPEDEDALARWRGLTLGVVFQFFQLLPSISLVKNVMIPMEFCGRFAPKERQERAVALLEQVGLAGHTHKRPSEISGGQQQRVAIARALANDPPILVADEPTGNLDSRTTSEIMEVFAGLVSAGKTLLVATHDPGVKASASRVVHLADGRIVS